MSDGETNEGRRPFEAPVSSKTRAPESGAPFVWGFVTATAFGIVGPFIAFFFSPIVMLLVVIIGLIKRDSRHPRSFANGLFFGGILWFLINGICSAAFLSMW